MTDDVSVNLASVSLRHHLSSALRMMIGLGGIIKTIRSSLALHVVSCRCRRENRPHESWDEIAQPWATWSKGDLAPNGTVMCRVTGYQREWHRQEGNKENSRSAGFCFITWQIKILMGSKSSSRCWAQKFGDMDPLSTIFIIAKFTTAWFYFQFQLKSSLT